MALHSGRLSSLDAAFLYFERNEAPMHIGAVCLFDGVVPYADYVAQVEAKLERLPRFRERVVATPLNAGHPTWETAPDFDVGEHVTLHQLGAPGDHAALQRLAGRLIEGMMNRARPLWALHVVHGLEGGRSAIVSKVHHATVDGVGGNEILTTVMDLAPQPPAPRGVEYEATTGMAPGRRIAEAIWDQTRSSIDAWSHFLTSMTDAGRAFSLERARTSVAVLTRLLPDLVLPPRRLPFNRRCSGGRRLAWTELSFAEARAIRSALGGTVNDVILTALGGGVARCSEARGVRLKGRTMRVMVPVNVRPDRDKASLGNQVSVLPVLVPLDIADPVERLQAVRQVTRALKQAQIAGGAQILSSLLGLVPAPLQGVLGAMATLPVPIFNLVCTNVPGPQIPLYAAGVPLVAYYPYVPIGFELGLGCAIFSYNQRLFVGLNSDTDACPDVASLLGALDAAFGELKAAAGVGEIPAVKVASQPVSQAAARAPRRGAARPRGKKKGAGKAAGVAPP